MKSVSKLDKIIYTIIKESNSPLVPSRINYLVKIIQLKEAQFDRPLELTWLRRGNFYFSDEVSLSLNKLVKYKLLKKHQVRILSSGNVQFSYEIDADLLFTIPDEIKSMILSLKSKRYYTCKVARILTLLHKLTPPTTNK